MKQAWRDYEEARAASSQAEKLDDPVVFELRESDIRTVAEDSDIPLEQLTPEVMRATRKMIENGLEHWAETVEVALRYALELAPEAPATWREWQHDKLRDEEAIIE